MEQNNARPHPIHHPEIPREEIVFPHPSEEEFARILDFYGIRWRYEPTTFPLRWNEQGEILEAFSPDFYLVDHDLYIELTTLRQKLLRVKKQKIACLRELYPEIRIKLLNRKDFVRLMERFGLEERTPDLVGKEALTRHGESGNSHSG